MKTQFGELVKHYSHIIGAFFVAGLLMVQNVSAIEKDQSRVQLQSEGQTQMVFSSEIKLSGSAYNHELLDHDCVLADELICRDLRP